MPGPRNKRKGGGKPKPPATQPVVQPNTAPTAPAARAPTSHTQNHANVNLCKTLDEEGITRCGLPATAGHPRTDGRPRTEWCKVHHGQYKVLYKKYKAAAQQVDKVRDGKELPTDGEIAQYVDRKVVMDKLKWVESFVKAIREERTGREIHNKRFFLKVDAGHKIRINILANEMEKANRVREKLGRRVLDLYFDENPDARWVYTPEDKKIVNEVLSKTTPGPAPAGKSTSTKPTAQGPSAPQGELGLGEEDDDLIAISHEAEKRHLCAVFEPFMDEDLGRKFSREMYISRGGDPMEPESDLSRYAGMLHYLTLCQYARRIVFYDPILFANSLGKVSFRDMILSNDFNIEDAIRFGALFAQVDGFPLPWMKDSVYEALEMMKRMKSGPPEHAAANLGKVDHRFKVLGSWIYNRMHTGRISDEVWWHLFRMVDPQAKTENRYVRLCNTYEDLVGMLSIGALGQFPPPHFCKFPENPELEPGALASRNHLSLSGVIVTDMSSPRRLFDGPIPTRMQATRRGNIVWAETEMRAYMFGAVRHETEPFAEAFLGELRKRPDLFQLLLWSETEPDSSLKEWGSYNGKALPPMRFRKYEAPMAFPPPLGHGEWETFRSARDILFETKRDKIIGYITNIRNQVPGWFFRFKKFPVRYFVVLDTDPTRHAAVLIRNVAWAALVAGKYGTGEYTAPKYCKASDKLFQEKAAQRLSWMDTNIFGSWTATKMADSDEDEVDGKKDERP